MCDCNNFIITFSILLSISYILILLLFIFSCWMYCQYRKKQETKYQRMRETRKGESFPNPQESTAEANASNHDASMTEDNADPPNERIAAPKRGVDVSMDNPNYMSNSTIRVYQEKDTTRLSVISQSHQRNENPHLNNRRVSKLDPKVSYSATDHPIVVVEEVSKNEEEDVYSLANESEHNYSCISNDASQVSQDNREDRDSVHDYSCISNNSRLSTSSSNDPNDPNEVCPIDDIEPADYEDFYSIPNAGDNISESEGENETESKKGGCEKKEEKENQEEQPGVNNQPDPDCQSDVKQTSVETTDKASKTKRRSATSSDIFNVQSTESSLAVHASDSRLTRLQGIEGRSSSAAAAPVTARKPVPKPRMLRKTAESTTK